MRISSRLSQITLVFLSIIPFIFSACETSGEEEYVAPENPLFETLTATETGVNFKNEVEDGEEFNVLSYRNFYNGGGVAIGDINGDGLDDLYFTANQGPNRLYLNQGDLRFSELTDAGGAAGAMAWSTGATIVDVNADGRMDIYVCNSGDPSGGKRSNELFINTGTDDAGLPTFTDQAEKFGLADKGFSTQAAWFDYDKDGDLDVYLLNNSYLAPDGINPNGQRRNIRDEDGGDKLLRNDGGSFTNVSEAAGIYSSRIGFGLGLPPPGRNPVQYLQCRRHQVQVFLPLPIAPELPATQRRQGQFPRSSTLQRGKRNGLELGSPPV